MMAEDDVWRESYAFLAFTKFDSLANTVSNKFSHKNLKDPLYGHLKNG